MNILKSTKKLFVKSKIYIPILLLLFISIIYKTIHLSQVVINKADVTEILGTTAVLLEFSLFYFIVFAFISYEFGCLCKRSNIEECLKSTKQGYSKFIFSQAVIIFICIAIFFVVQLLSNLVFCILYDEWHFQYLMQTFFNCFLSFLLIPLLGELFGLVLSQSVNRLNSYLLLAFVSLLSSSIVNDIAITLNETAQINIFSFINLFNPYPPSLDWTPVFSFGHSILPYRWTIVLFWLFLLTALLHINVHGRQKYLKKISIILPVILSIVCLVITCAPQSRVLIGSDDPKNSIMNDYNYYRKNQDSRNEKANFGITDCDLELSIGLELKATAAMCVDKPDLDEYHFTFYHGYLIDSLRDENNEKLKFEQAGDYLTIYNENKNLNSFTLKYHGHSNICYSNVQGIFLPAYFPYYPHAGFESIYDTGHQSYNRLSNDKMCNYTVKINGPQKYYCNLDETEKNTFSGNTNGLTILAGMYEETEIDGVTLIYPYLKPREYTAESMAEFIHENKGTPAFNDDVKKVMIIPSVDASTYTSYVAYSDYIITLQILGFSDRFREQQIPSYKEDLKSVYQMYISAPELFAETLEGAKTLTEPTIEVYIADYVDYIGEEEALANIEQYLNDDSDTRTYQEFFADELGGTD